MLKTKIRPEKQEFTDHKPTALCCESEHEPGWIRFSWSLLSCCNLIYFNPKVWHHRFVRTLKSAEHETDSKDSNILTVGVSGSQVVAQRTDHGGLPERAARSHYALTGQRWWKPEFLLLPQLSLLNHLKLRSESIWFKRESTVCKDNIMGCFLLQFLPWVSSETATDD